jgi:hypothetical protein
VFEYLEASSIDKNGIETICAKVNPYRIDENGLGNGKVIVMVNNYAKGTFEIEENRHVYGWGQFIRSIKKGKEETKTVSEFREWLINNGYSDEDFINAMKATYPDTYEKYYKR